MLLTTLLILLPFTLAIPLSPRAPFRSFHLTAARSASPIHLQPITASSSGLFIGPQTSAYCPSPPLTDCASFSNNTQLSCASSDGSATGCSMAVTVPGGQLLYVDGSTGALRYTQPHSAYVPPSALTSGFEYTAAGNGSANGLGRFGFCGGGGSGLFACEVEGQEGVWRVTAGIEGVDVTGCLGMGVVTSGTNESAWEYT